MNPDDIRSEVLDLYESGMSARAVAAEVCVGVSYVLNVVRSAGVVRAPGRLHGQTWRRSAHAAAPNADLS